MDSPFDAPLPALRDDLKLSESATSINGEPSWVIQDTVINRFYQIGWLEFECLLRWGGTARQISSEIAEQTPLNPEPEQVLESFASFLKATNYCVRRLPQLIACKSAAKAMHGSAGNGGCIIICSSASRCFTRKTGYALWRKN